MKSFKRTISLILALALLLSLSACGEKKEENKAEPLKIGVPSDATNQARAITLLETAGLIEVDDAAGFTPELKDVTKYIYNIEIGPAAANTLVSTLDDYGASTINGTYAVPAGLVPSRDGLITEVQDSGSGNPFINVIVARTADKDNEDYKTIVKAYQTQTIAQYILEKNSGSSIPAFCASSNSDVSLRFAFSVRTGSQSTSKAF